jgi:uncharacterized protein YdeI (YjbR/CyaY-like superfamily)
MNIIFFDSQEAFREWLAENGSSATEVWLGFYTKKSGKTGITPKQALDEALCAGWIDGIRKKLDADSYINRYTPRRKGSFWSAVNIRRVHELIELSLMQPAGLKAFNERDMDKVQMYSSAETERELDPESVAIFQANPKAWAFFQSQAPYYQRNASWWVVSAKREVTRQKRLATLIELSEKGEWIPQMRRPEKS